MDPEKTSDIENIFSDEFNVMYFKLEDKLIGEDQNDE